MPCKALEKHKPLKLGEQSLAQRKGTSRVQETRARQTGQGKEGERLGRKRFWRKNEYAPLCFVVRGKERGQKKERVGYGFLFIKGENVDLAGRRSSKLGQPGEWRENRIKGKPPYEKMGTWTPGDETYVFKRIGGLRGNANEGGH